VSAPRVALVACGATKLDHAAPAKDLYTGQLFRKARAYAEANADAWYVLSARHGLVAPETIVEPYDARMPLAAADRRRWGHTVASALQYAISRDHGVALVKRGKFLAFPPDSFELLMLAGRDYVDPLAEALSWSGRTDHYSIDDPMKGLGIGHRLAFLTPREVAS
jgi:hypothetical protein